MAFSPLAPSQSVHVEGLDELNALLKQLPKRLRTNRLKRGIRAAIKVTKQDIDITAPIREDEHIGYRKGTLRPPPGRLQRLVKVKARKGKKTWLKVSLIYPTIGDGDDPKNAFYWRFLEDGTKHMPAQPFVQPAVDRTFNRVIRVMTGETKKGVEEEIRQLRSRA